MSDSQYQKQIMAIRFILIVTLIEFLIFIVSGVSLSYQYGNTFFSIGVDPAFWLFYLMKVPQTIALYKPLGMAIDACIVLLLVLLIYNPKKFRIAAILFILMLLFYTTLTGFLSHRNYQTGFILVLIPFMFREINQFFAYNAIRYFLLFYYLSSAVFKISNGLSNTESFSSVLVNQFSPYFLENNTGWRTDLNLYLIYNPGTSFFLYCSAIVLELSALIGFFTKKYDVVLCLLFLAFHVGNWVIMDIAPMGHISFVLLLLISKYYIAPNYLNHMLKN
jgi:hypothetical protein